MEPSKRSSLFKVASVEAAIIGVLVVLIVFTLNYFKIISLNSFLPFLPQNTSSNSKNLSQNSSGKCQNIPQGISTQVTQPDSSLNEQIKSFVGVWEGKWGEITPAALIVRSVSNQEMVATYIYNKKSVLEYKFPAGQNRSFGNGILTWTIDPNSKTLTGSFSVRDRIESLVLMEKCNP